MRQCAGNRRGDDLIGTGGDRDCRWNVIKDQKRRDQKAAADAEQSGEKTHGGAHAEKNQHVDR
ncbi:hypothetical protein D3C80_2134910 [compost metagenome]